MGTWALSASSHSLGFDQPTFIPSICLRQEHLLYHSLFDLYEQHFDTSQQSLLVNVCYHRQRQFIAQVGFRIQKNNSTYFSTCTSAALLPSKHLLGIFPIITTMPGSLIKLGLLSLLSSAALAAPLAPDAGLVQRDAPAGAAQDPYVERFVRPQPANTPAAQPAAEPAYTAPAASTPASSGGSYSGGSSGVKGGV